jgi:hypothetical protein
VKPAKTPKAVPTKHNGKAKAAPKPKKAAEPAKRGVKRPTPDTNAKPQKKRKVAVSLESEEEESTLSSPPDEGSGVEDDASEEEAAKPAPKKAQKPRAKRVTKSPEVKRTSIPARRESRKVVDSDEEVASPAPKPDIAEPAQSDEDVKDEKEEENPAPKAPPPPPAEADASDSEMSVLIDEEPAPKKKRQKKDPDAKHSKTKSTKSTKPSSKTKKPDLSPTEEEIKRLQSQLLKCGIRKLWHKELAPYTTPSTKISHLKGMLKDAGMEGRFSEAKAREIKERRELEADMEATKEYERKFGAQDDSERRMKGPKDWGIDEELLGSGGEDSD